MQKMITGIVAMVLTALPAAASHRMTRSDQRVLDKAAQVLEVSTSAPDGGIPKDLLERAECVLVFPGVKKGAFIVGGKYGRGVATCRQTDGRLSPPSFFTIGGASVGFQWGGSSTDLVLLVMNKDGVKSLLKDELTVGAEASAAIGPVGRTAKADTDALLGTQLLSWSRSRGAFAGAALDGAVVKPARDANERLYGRDVSPESVLVKATVPMPPVAQDFIATVAKVANGGMTAEARP